jgi:hypothetical protein
MRVPRNQVSFDEVGNIWIQGKPFQFYAVEIQRLQQCCGFAGELFAIHLIEGHNAAFDDPREQVIQRHFGRSVNIKIQVQHADQKGGVFVELGRNGFPSVPGHQFNFWNMADRTVCVVYPAKIFQFLDNCRSRLKRSRPGMLGFSFGQVFFMDAGEASESIESDDAPGVIVRFIDAGKLHPSEQPAAGENPAFHHAAIGRKRQFEKLAFHQESRHILTSGMPGEGLKFLSETNRRFAEGGIRFVHHTAFGGCVFFLMVPKDFETFIHWHNLRSIFLFGIFHGLDD